MMAGRFNSNSEKSFNMSSEAMLSKFRSIVSKMMDMGEYKAASFWCNKILSFSNHDKADVYKQAKCFFLLKEYHRAAHCLKSKNLHLTDLASRHLAAKCHVSTEFSNNNFNLDRS